MRERRILVVIERLVLDGIELDGIEREALTRAIASGLADHAGESPLRVGAGGARDRVAAPDIAIPAASGGAPIGRSVAGALHAALGDGAAR